MELVKNPLFARYFDRCGARLEERGGREIRGELLAGLSGRVVEVGAGTGMGGCHVHRDTLAAIGRVFTVEACRGFRFPPSAVLSPPGPRILGTARKAGTPGD